MKQKFVSIMTKWLIASSRYLDDNKNIVFCRPITSHYKQKPTATRSTGVFMMDNGGDTGSSLDAIKGFGFQSNDPLPPGVRSQG